MHALIVMQSVLEVGSVLVLNLLFGFLSVSGSRISRFGLADGFLGQS